jgi:hypothetical protein
MACFFIIGTQVSWKRGVSQVAYIKVILVPLSHRSLVLPASHRLTASIIVVVEAP